MPAPFDLPLTWATVAGIGIGVLALYLARARAQAFIRAAFAVLIRLLRLLAQAMAQWSHRCDERHRLLLVNLQAEELEAYIESRRRRAEGLFSGRLAGYPALHDRLSAALDRTGQGQPAAAPDAAPAPPATRLSARTGRRLAAVRGDLVTLRDLDRRVEIARRDVTTSVAEYRALLGGPSRRAATAGRSALVLVLIGLLVAVAALGGAALNFRLIARPLSEIVGEGFQVLGYPLSDVLALGIILVEAVAGALLMDFLGVTRLFPVADRLEDRHRRLLAIAVGAVVLAFSLIEASLALVREDIVQLERQLGAASGSGGGTPSAAVPPSLAWLPQVVQASLGFVMPWVLALVAIPLEQLLKYGRVLLQAAGAAGFGALGALLRVTAGVVGGLRDVVLVLYDLLVFLPLFIEGIVARHAARRAARNDP